MRVHIQVHGVGWSTLVFPRPTVSPFAPSLPPCLSLFFSNSPYRRTSQPFCNFARVPRKSFSQTCNVNFGEEARAVQAATRLNINSSFPSINSTCAFAAPATMFGWMMVSHAVESTEGFARWRQTLSTIARRFEIIEIVIANVTGGTFYLLLSQKAIC